MRYVQCALRHWGEQGYLRGHVMNPATTTGGRTKRFRREGSTQEGHGVASHDGRMLPESPAGPARPEVGSAAISGMKGVAVNATVSFAAPAAADLLKRGVAARPRTDVIARIKSNTKTHRGTPRPEELEEGRITGDYEKPNETAASQQRPLDMRPEDITASKAPRQAQSPRTRAFSSAQIKPPSAPALRPPPSAEEISRRTPLQRAPDALLHPAGRAPRPDGIIAAGLQPVEAPARWPVTAIVVASLLIALLGGLIAMAATGG